jgi:hypothetical protein
MRAGRRAASASARQGARVSPSRAGEGDGALADPVGGRPADVAVPGRLPARDAPRWLPRRHSCSRMTASGGRQLPRDTRVRVPVRREACQERGTCRTPADQGDLRKHRRPVTGHSHGKIFAGRMTRVPRLRSRSVITPRRTRRARSRRYGRLAASCASPGVITDVGDLCACLRRARKPGFGSPGSCTAGRVR